MRIFAYCDQAFANSMRWVAGVEPATSPPTTCDTFEPGWLEERDLIVIDLHGERGLDYWYAIVDGPIPERIVALRADQIRQADLDGAVIFATSCYLGEEDSPMLQALLDAGAGTVIGGAGENWAGARKVAGAGLLALFFRMFLEAGVSPLKALHTAKQSMQIVAKNSQAKRDALAFRAFKEGEYEYEDQNENAGGRA